MDAASNNSVDDIRDLREKVAYAPVSGRHKVYILDEAHMLSPQAWNAFLKTLEEPPPRTIFVLATTEAQKVLPTVVDRCHRFDFGRPSVEQVATVLRRVADQERIDIDDGAVALIARHATGSFRDALGTLEQLVTYAGEQPIEPADVLAVLGVADAEQLFGAVEAIVARDPAQALRAAARLAESGRDPGQVLRDLEVHGRELLTVQVLGEVPPELRVTPERDAPPGRAGRGAVARPTPSGCSTSSPQALDATANGAQARIQLELVLIKAAAPEVDPSIAALLAADRAARGRPAVGRRACAPSPSADGPARRRRSEPAGPSGRQSAQRQSADQLPRAEPPSAQAAPEIQTRRRDARSRHRGHLVAGGRRHGAGAQRDARRAARRRPARGDQRARADGRVPGRGRVPEAQGRAGRPPAGHRRGAADGDRPGARPCATSCARTTSSSSRAGRRRSPGRSSCDASWRSSTPRSSSKTMTPTKARPASDAPQPNMQQLLKQAQKMQEDMIAAQEALKDEIVEASAGGGMVTVKVTGDLEVKSITIDPQAVDPDDVELLQDMVLAAVNEALRSAQELASDKLGGIAGGLGGGLGGLGLPGM